MINQPQHHTPGEQLIRILREFIAQHNLIVQGDKIIAAVSGGIDSMVLLHMLNALKSDLNLGLAVAHFNHQLRNSESDGDEAFVRAMAAKYGLECYVERANTSLAAESKKTSLQEAARDLRYTFFHKLRNSLGYEKIATAHQADDNAETVLFNLFRGSGVHGLSGIPLVRKDLSVIRPLLFATRDQITDYASTSGITYREDSSNGRQEYTRNFIRATLVPLIRENINPNLSMALRKTAELFDQIEQYLVGEAAARMDTILVNRTPGEIVLDAGLLQAEPVFLQEHLILHTAREFVRSEIDFNTVKTIFKVCHAETGSSCNLANDIVAYKNRDSLVFKRISAVPPFRFNVEVDRRYNFELFSFSATTSAEALFSDDPRVEYVDGERLPSPMTLRNWNDGDWFIPLGMTEKKKVSDFFVDEKVPLFEKQRIPILVAHNDVVWVCGMRIDDRFKITENTTRIVRLEYTPEA